MRADESFVDSTISWLDDQLFPVGQTDDAPAVVEDGDETAPAPDAPLVPATDGRAA